MSPLPAEDRLIPLLTRSWKTGGDVRVGPGDDCAVLRLGGKTLLFKTDAVVEGVHFLPATPAPLAGRKALARAVSDVAAMGGRPTHALVTLALPPRTAAARVAGLYKGLSALAEECGVALVGGETTRAPRLLLSISLLGLCAAAPVLRSGGKPGDDLWVTGPLGRNATRAGKNHHLRFTPRLKEGAWLARNRAAHAMMDLSDGLAADLPRLAQASRCGFRLDPALLARAAASGATPAQALQAGEDYELLFAAPPRLRARLERWPFPHAPCRIGALTAPGRGQSPRTLGHGFDHFA
ncbi:MAG: thiamine-phosphate kinase [Verrucomicrobium sp.]|nr:thiamine-phosphate kinase [Verrucomicrobium sp.]